MNVYAVSAPRHSSSTYNSYYELSLKLSFTFCVTIIAQKLLPNLSQSVILMFTKQLTAD